jgi:hypothetical protein
MIILYIFVFLFAVGALIKINQVMKENKSPYRKLLKKFEEEKLIADFSGDWKKKQEINLQILWLKTILEVENNLEQQSNTKQGVTYDINNFSLEDIKFISKWKLDDFYCFPFAQAIVDSYKKLLSEIGHNAMYKSNSILPLPKNYIRKAILFLLDYLRQENPIYEVNDKQKYIDYLHIISVDLDRFFIETGNTELPTTLAENRKVGNALRDKQDEFELVEDEELIDWN